ncbi:MAG: hypothetical protein KA319_09395 [Ferruginibacter sp.]|nr:hypothetical protein [Ferruginibacter sp.]
MLDNLFNMVKELSGDAVVNNPEVPNEYNNDVIAEATKTVAGGLQNMVAGGGLQNILSLFGGGGQQSSGKGLMGNPIVSMMVGHFANKLMSKFGLGGGQASNVAQSLIPNVLSGLINKTNDPNNSSFTLDSLLNSLTGGASQQVAQQQQQQDGGFSFQNLISQFTGGGQQQSGGGGGLMDLVGKLAGGATQAQAQQGGGGLMDMIKGFMK